jgi:2-polyprenyl-6-methoxyphenol hydroxylase-like FAD-dependent oxidoreductase
VGINLAIQDAVAAANLLGPKLQQNKVTESDLEAVQRRRSFPTRSTQRFQIMIQNNVIRKILGTDKTLSAPWVLKLLQRWPVLRRIPARVLGLGFRPEHVKAR